MLGRRLAIMLLPEPGEPMSRMLWPPAAAISRALLTFSCPLTSAKSGDDRPIQLYPFEHNDTLGYWESKSNLYKGLHMYHILDSLGTKAYLSRIDDSTHTAAVNGKPVELTFKEYALLELLLAQAGKVVTREEIFSRVWNMDTEIESRTLDMHIRTLRQKLGDAGSYVQTIRKVGYKLEAPQHETTIH